MKALTQTAAPLVVERPDSKQMNERAVCIEYVKILLVCSYIVSTRAFCLTTCPQTCRAFKDETRSYCLSAAGGLLVLY